MGCTGAVACDAWGMAIAGIPSLGADMSAIVADACADGAVPIMSGCAKALNANAVHASNAMPSTTRKQRKRGRSQQRMRGR